MNELDRRKKQGVDLNTIANDWGKIPPQAVDLEEAVLGGLLLEPDKMYEISEKLIPESFYKEAHKEIFTAISTLFQAGKNIDLLTVINQLKSTAKLDIVGGAYYITQLTNRIASASNIEFHAQIVAQKAIQRGLIKLSSETIKKSFTDEFDIFETIDSLSNGINDLTSNIITNAAVDSFTLFKDLVARNNKLLETKGLVGIPTGFKDLDIVTGGWQPTDLIILAARPGMGKTSLTLQFLSNPAMYQNKPTAIFSLEMSNVQLYARLQSQVSGLPLESILKKGLDGVEQQVMLAHCGKLIEAPIYFDDKAGLTLLEFRLKAQKLKREKKIELIVIDYLQLMKGSKGQNRDSEIGEITRGLKAIAKDLDLPIIALAQLSRAVETRGGAKKPLLSDLRESGSIEQDADMVIFIYRPEYYGLEVDEDNMPTRGLANIIIAKHRNGGLAEIPLKWTAEQTKFSNWGDDFGSSQFPTMKPNNNFEDESPF